MSPVTVFFRTLLRSSAIFLGAGYIVLNPSLDWSASSRAAVTARQGPVDAAVDGLIAALKDTDAGVRRHAAFALGELRSVRAVPALIGALEDEEATVRRCAALVLLYAIPGRVATRGQDLRSSKAEAQAACRHRGSSAGTAGRTR